MENLYSLQRYYCIRIVSFSRFSRCLDFHFFLYNLRAYYYTYDSRDSLVTTVKFPDVVPEYEIPPLDEFSHHDRIFNGKRKFLNFFAHIIFPRTLLNYKIAVSRCLGNNCKISGMLFHPKQLVSMSSHPTIHEPHSPKHATENLHPLLPERIRFPRTKTQYRL